ERWRRRRSGLDGTAVMLRGSPGYEGGPEIPVAPWGVVGGKTAHGAFTHTDLGDVLRARDITHPLFRGCTPGVGRHPTLREAVDRNFQCLLIEDACASADRYAHEAAIHMVTVEDGVFGTVARSADVLGALRGVAAQ